MKIDEKLNKIEDEITKEAFHENKGLGNEIGYYIFDYEPKYEMKVRKHIKYLKEQNHNFEILEFDLYTILIEILESKGYLEKTFKLEEKNGLNKTNQLLAKLLQISNDKNNLIIKYIKDRVLENSIVFITGVGKIFPILRSHDVLNNLHHHIDKNPVVMFFPGKYTGNEFILFGTIPDKNYYRAFPLINE